MLETPVSSYRGENLDWSNWESRTGSDSGQMEESDDDDDDDDELVHWLHSQSCSSKLGVGLLGPAHAFHENL